MNRFKFSSIMHDGQVTITREHWNEIVDRIIELETFVAEVELNAPEIKPTKLEPRSLSQAWSFWVAGTAAGFLMRREKQEDTPNANP